MVKPPQEGYCSGLGVEGTGGGCEGVEEEEGEFLCHLGLRSVSAEVEILVIAVRGLGLEAWLP